MSDSFVFQDRNFVLGVFAAGATFIAAVSYVIFGPDVWRKNSLKCTGLINLGNTCFVNAVLQAIASLPQVFEWLKRCQHKHNGKLITGLKNILHELDLGEKLEVSPQEVLSGLIWHGWMLDNQQQDALELYNVLLSTIDEELEGAQNSLTELQRLLEVDNTQMTTSVLTKLGRTVSPIRPPYSPLRGLLVSTLRCCRCRQQLPTKYEYFDSLSLPLKAHFSGQVTLESCLKDYMSPEIVTGVECAHCSKSTSVNERRTFTKTLLIGRLPKCLCIHIVRTVWLSDGSISKNDTHLKFPVSFDIGQFMEHSDNSSRIYRLQAVIEHRGGPYSGHYCTYRRLDKQWMYTSDSSVYSVSTHEVKHCQAYMLFYQRIS